MLFTSLKVSLDFFILMDKLNGYGFLDGYVMMKQLGGEMITG
jgi:hypothetical protein